MMALPWMLVLKHVPWADVIRNAPKVAESARRLWKTVARKPPATAPVPAGEGTAPLLPVEARVAALEQTVTDLHAQMLASSELIQALADQNTELVLRIQANRRRTGWLYAFMVILAVSLAWLAIGSA